MLTVAEKHCLPGVSAIQNTWGSYLKFWWLVIVSSRILCLTPVVLHKPKQQQKAPTLLILHINGVLHSNVHAVYASNTFCENVFQVSLLDHHQLLSYLHFCDQWPKDQTSFRGTGRSRRESNPASSDFVVVGFEWACCHAGEPSRQHSVPQNITVMLGVKSDSVGWIHGAKPANVKENHQHALGFAPDLMLLVLSSKRKFQFILYFNLILFSSL